MVTYLAKFAPNLSEITCPLRMLLAKDTLFSLDTLQMNVFNIVKDVITFIHCPMLAYFDNQRSPPYNVTHPNMVLVLRLCKKESPLHLPQRASHRVRFTIRKGDACFFGCKRFHQYLYSRTVKVETDHKPLKRLFQHLNLDYRECCSSYRVMTLMSHMYQENSFPLPTHSLVIL